MIQKVDLLPSKNTHFPSLHDKWQSNDIEREVHRKETENVEPERVFDRFRHSDHPFPCF